VHSWTDDELLAELTAWAEATDHATTTRYERDRASSDRDLPPLSTICNRFGGWHAALAEIGRASTRRAPRRYQNEELIAAVRGWLISGGDRRAESYSRAAAAAGLPSFNTVYLRFGSWQTALELAQENQ
jgi:hypothetical protein